MKSNYHAFLFALFLCSASFLESSVGVEVAVQGGTLPASSGLGAVSVASFSIGKYEVTWAEWQTVRTWAAANGYDIGAIGAGLGVTYPVQMVNWYDCLKWCNAKSQMEGLTPAYTVSGATYKSGVSVPSVNAAANGYRLPTEAEWEWAARGGTLTHGYTYSGSNTIDAVAWYSVNSAGSTHVVGTKAANELGLYDMSGNVWEWCWGSTYRLRGGSWSDNLAVSFRQFCNPDFRLDGVGFRLTRTSAPLLISSEGFGAGSIGQAFTGQLSSSGGTEPFTWQVASGSLPTGLSVTAAGLISGTPTVLGSFPFTVQVTDTNGTSSMKQLEIRVIPTTSTGGGYGFSNLAGNPTGFNGSADGTGGSFSGSADGTGSGAGVYGASGVAVDAAGNVYVSDSGNNLIRKVTSSGVVTTLAGRFSGSADGTGSAASFSNPQGMALDASGNIYVAEYNNHMVRKVTSAGAVAAFSGSAGFSGSADGNGATAKFNQPADVAVDSGGNVYVADSGNHAIRKISSNGTVTTLAGTMGSKGSANGTGAAARFQSPQGVAVDPAGNVYVADTGNCLIRKITTSGDVSTFAGAAFTGSAGACGRASFTGSAHASFIGSADVSGFPASVDDTGAAARFSYPTDIEVDNAGSLYVTDSGTGKIRKITSDGAVTTLGGNPDGFFYNPLDIAVGATGKLYVADAGNNRIAGGIGNLPEITMEQPSGTDLQSNAAAVSQGNNLLGVSSDAWTYTLRNTGGADLSGLVLTKSGSAANDFSVSALSATTLASGNSTTFTVTFTPTAGSGRTAQLSIASNDADENPFLINLSGFGISSTVDTDGDGLNDAAEYKMSTLGFDWQVAQPTLVSTLADSVNTAGYYSTSQVQALHIGTPLLTQNPTTGLFKLTIAVQKSTNLQTFTSFPLSEQQTFVNGQGEVEYEFSVPDKAAFFRLESR